MKSSISDVNDKIDELTSTSTTVNSRRMARSSTISCTAFINKVTAFKKIASKVSKVDSITSMASEISNAKVDTCTTDNLDSLESLSEELDRISDELTTKINYYSSFLSGIKGSCHIFNIL